VREASSAYERKARAARRNRANQHEETPDMTPCSPAATSPTPGITTSVTAD
jgi:hypothetical protein